MQLVKINGVFRDVSILESVKAILLLSRTWISLTLGAGYSSNVKADGPQSAEAQCNRNSACRAKFVTKIDKCRLNQKAAWIGLNASLVPTLALPVIPKGGTLSRRSKQPQIPGATCRKQHSGIFARCLIPPYQVCSVYILVS